MNVLLGNGLQFYEALFYGVRKITVGDFTVCKALLGHGYAAHVEAVEQLGCQLLAYHKLSATPTNIYDEPTLFCRP